MLLFIVILNGCSVTTFLGGVSPDRPIYVINVPPNRIGYGGKVTKEDGELMLNVLDKMLKKQYHNHHYAYPAGIGVNIDSSIIKSDTFSGSTSIKKRRR